MARRFSPPVNIRFQDTDLDRVRQNLDRQVKELQDVVQGRRLRVRRFSGWNAEGGTETTDFSKTGGRYIANAAQGVVLPWEQDENERLLTVNAVVEAPSGAVVLLVRVNNLDATTTQIGDTASTVGTAIQLLTLNNLNAQASSGDLKPVIISATLPINGVLHAWRLVTEYV